MLLSQIDRLRSLRLQEKNNPGKEDQGISASAVRSRWRHGVDLFVRQK
jgi:hypothetical protein